MEGMLAWMWKGNLGRRRELCLRCAEEGEDVGAANVILLDEVALCLGRPVPCARCEGTTKVRRDCGTSALCWEDSFRNANCQIRGNSHRTRPLLQHSVVLFWCRRDCENRSKRWRKSSQELESRFVHRNRFSPRKHIIYHHNSGAVWTVFMSTSVWNKSGPRVDMYG